MKKGGEAESLEEDVHLSVPTDNAQFGNFLASPTSKFLQKSISHAKPNGLFELKQILVSLNMTLDDDDLE